MKVTIECEQCGNKAELTPETVGNHAYVIPKINGNNLTVFETAFEKEVRLSAYSEFIDHLAKAKTKEEVETYLEDEINYNTEAEVKISELRIDCKSCGDYIVLTRFED
ncbi:hypothetical protein KGF86_01830 [Ornithinibacillus massiliensis]|uniref:Uncharacterized protein n=1 Tax=Ornithinibacillus massiliensis TaxID=1944633 RepID=A0ABS5M9E9_9BACI|nr:hypothetical protein [Ornithinibacillus massiliensis]MBS3678944.1 hypothetical protein [Ornithinibacillus massiliensis]